MHISHFSIFLSSVAERGHQFSVKKKKVTTIDSSDNFNMPHPLPINPYVAGSEMYKAYRRCLEFEGNDVQAPWSSGPSSLVCARLLGYMIIHLPTNNGRTNISNEINSCGGLDNLHELAKLYIDHFLRSCE
jgi:hypothetical protein